MDYTYTDVPEHEEESFLEYVESLREQDSIIDVQVVLNNVHEKETPYYTNNIIQFPKVKK